MLHLSPEQARCLSDIARERALRRLGAALAAAFPDMAGRAGDRFPALVAHGAQRAQTHGITDGVCVARYLACWFVWGADFESQPGFEWAGAILGGSATGSQGAKVFQLCRRSAEELQRRAAPGLPARAVFEAAVAQLDTQLDGPPPDRLGVLDALAPTPRVPLGAPCDLDAVDIRLADSGWRQHYRIQDGQWQRLPCAPAVSGVTLAASTAPPAAGPDAAPPPALPAQITVLSQPAGHAHGARLKVRTRAAHVCDAQVHPLVSHNHARGITDWRGRLAAEVLLALPAEPPAPPPPERLQPLIAFEGSPALSLLSLQSCGLRDVGTALGELQTQIAVYPAEQWLLAWRREPGPARSWPASVAESTASAPARCRLERDGQPQDARRWQAGLEELDRQLADGLSRLQVAWEREGGVAQGRLNAEPAVLAGATGLTWGWAEGPGGVTEAPTLRAEGLADLVACELKLQLSGQCALDGTLSLLQLTLKDTAAGSTRLAGPWRRDAAQPDWAAALKPAQLAFRHEFELLLTPLAADSLALASVDGPVSGALVGSVGLRLRGDAPGLQWFAHLAIEAVSVPLALRDPLLGEQRLRRPLLPAMTLLDWSLG